MLSIELKNLVKTYTQGEIKVHALKGIDLEIKEGEFAVICGPSGSGKTTALNIIGALDVPTTGTVKVRGEDLSGMSKGELAQMRLNHIGFVFQAYNLIPVLSAFENAEFVLMLRGMDKQERKQKVEAILKEVGLESMMDRLPNQLSGGQQQRVAIARAVVAEPALILADEPTANVDSKTAEALLDLMENLNRNHGVTFLFTTHDPRVMKRARRIITLQDGEIISDVRQNGV